ncbi:MAG: fimbria/pilus periplasmic chaperone [Hyphomonadaceae bacterium]|nr:fimbria/pilus periplasmic chaperone [Hyphomonadaceae bacterium]
MNNTLRALCAASAALVLSGSLQPVYAVTLMPLTLVMERDKAVVVLHVQNDEARTKIFEVQAFLWSQEGGEDKLEPAVDLVVTPPIVKLAPGEKKIIRVGVMQKNTGRTDEKAYRLLLRDITPIELQAGQLHLQMQYLLPLFMSPSRPQSGVQLVEFTSPDNPRCIQITNTGNIHAKLVWTAADGAPASISPAQKYVLAGGQALYCPAKSSTDEGHVVAGVTSAYQNEVTSYEVLPPSH